MVMSDVTTSGINQRMQDRDVFTVEKEEAELGEF